MRKKKQKTENVQCCHVFPARLSAFRVASPTFLLHLPSTLRTVTTVSDHNQQNSYTKKKQKTHIHSTRMQRKFVDIKNEKKIKNNGTLTHDGEGGRGGLRGGGRRKVGIKTRSLRGRSERGFGNQFGTPMYRFLHATGRGCGAFFRILRFRSRSLSCGGISVRDVRFGVSFGLRWFHAV